MSNNCTKWYKVTGIHKIWKHPGYAGHMAILKVLPWLDVEKPAAAIGVTYNVFLPTHRPQSATYIQGTLRICAHLKNTIEEGAEWEHGPWIRCDLIVEQCN